MIPVHFAIHDVEKIIHLSAVVCAKMKHMVDNALNFDAFHLFPIVIKLWINIISGGTSARCDKGDRFGVFLNHIKVNFAFTV